MDLKNYLAIKRREVEDALERYMLQAEGPMSRHIEAMRYSLFAGGKRVRPILCMAAAEAVASRTNRKSIMPTAVALECIHTYSLIHDDLPAMDDDELRRGKPTNHVVFGEADAILAGDGLLSFAFELLSAPAEGISSPKQLQVINHIAGAVGSLGMVGGQALDIENEGKDIDLVTLQLIHKCKTGKLITVSVQAGALLADCSKTQLSALTRYGEKIGLAFQIVDDYLNATSTTEQLGKAAGSDAERSKATYPAFFGIEETRRKAAQAVDDAVNSLEEFDDKADYLRELALYILNRTK